MFQLTLVRIDLKSNIKYLRRIPLCTVTSDNLFQMEHSVVNEIGAGVIAKNVEQEIKRILKAETKDGKTVTLKLFAMIIDNDQEIS